MSVGEKSRNREARQQPPTTSETVIPQSHEHKARVGGGGGGGGDGVGGVGFVFFFNIDIMLGGGVVGWVWVVVFVWFLLFLCGGDKRKKSQFSHA